MALTPVADDGDPEVPEDRPCASGRVEPLADYGAAGRITLTPAESNDTKAMDEPRVRLEADSWLKDGTDRSRQRHAGSGTWAYGQTRQVSELGSVRLVLAFRLELGRRRNLNCLSQGFLAHRLADQAEQSLTPGSEERVEAI